MLILDWVGPLKLSLEQVFRIPGGVPGIYMLHALIPSNGIYATFYVGKTSDLQRRLRQHMNQSVTKPLISAMQCVQTCFWSAAPIEDEYLLGCVESGLIRTLQPVCNNQVPKDRPILVTLPPLRLTNVFQEDFK